MNPILPLESFTLLAIAVLGLTGLASWYTARKVSVGWRLGITTCRILGVSGILLLMLNLGFTRERFEASDSCWAIMVDNSASMAFKDIASGSRWDTAVKTTQTALSLSENKKNVLLYSFGAASTRIQEEDLPALQPDGMATQIVAVGQNMLIQEKSRGSNLRGILLLSDGRQTVQGPPEPFALRAAAGNTPIYPLVLGDDVPSSDIEIDLPRRKLVSFKGQPVTFKGTLRNHRMGPVKTDIQLQDSHGKVLERRDLLAADNQQVDFRFDLTIDAPGYYEYAIVTPLRQAESDRANNRIDVGVFVMADRLNVLMLEGEPYWDTKFLSHLLRAQTNISMTAVFRVAKDKFFKVSTGSDMTSSDTDVFPDTAEALAEFDLVVLGRGTEYFVDELRAKRLDDYVKKQGGCLFFARGKSYEGANSLLQPLEPVSWDAAIRSDFKMHPMLAGEQVGLFGGLLPDREDRLWDELPVLNRAYACGGLKSFASVLAQGITAASPDAPFPLLISKRHGNGLVLLINGDGLWKWGFSPDAAGESDLYQNLWIQLFQWAVSFAEFNPGSDYLIRTDRSNVAINTPFRVLVRARAHIKKADIVVRVYRTDQSANPLAVQTMALAGDTLHNGGWGGILALSTPGIYRLVAETPDGKDLAARTSIQILPPPGETDNYSADPVFLNELAQSSGGRMVTPDDLPALVKQFEIPEKAVRKGDIVWETLWDRAWVCMLIMLFFSLEWYLRRRQGLH